jgi:hypothetical protein
MPLTKTHRIEILKLGLSMFRSSMTHIQDLELSAIYTAIRLGTLEGRPFDAGDLAVATGIPRSTIIRKLTQQVEIAKVVAHKEGRRIVYHMPEVTPEWEAGMRTARKNILKAAVAIMKEGHQLVDRDDLIMKCPIWTLWLFCLV